jgi:hypothetical protein
MARAKRIQSASSKGSAPAVRKGIALVFIAFLVAALLLALFQKISWLWFWIIAALAYLVSIALKKNWL